MKLSPFSKTVPGLVAALLCFALLGCSTPASRIRNAPELFAGYPPETQQLIREGKVGIGFDATMVRLAVGDPDRKWDRTDANGQSEVWGYTRFETMAGTPLFSGGYHRYYGGLYPYYGLYPARKVHDYFRVTFKSGKVVAVETDTAPEETE